MLGQTDIRMIGIRKVTVKIKYNTQAGERLLYIYQQERNEHRLQTKHSMYHINWYGEKQLIKNGEAW